MNFKMIFKTLGRLLLVEAFLMLAPLIVSLIYKENNHLSFLIPIGSLLVVGLLLSLLKPKRKIIFAREGLVITGLSWIFLSLFGCLPFILSKQIPSFFDAFFETVSGFTTTGASIITDIDSWYATEKSLLFWRSFSHWIGGMGILVFIIAILPKSEGQNIHIMKAEATGPQVGKLVSKIKLSARIIYLIYFALTILQIVILSFDPEMPFFDAIIHSIGTAGTGGFGIRAAGVGYYSDYSQIVIAIFMVLFGINFNIFFFLLVGKFKQAFKNEELWWYFGIIIISVLLITIDIYNDVSLAYNSLGKAAKDSFFQVSSIITTTGFSTVDFSKWSTFSQTILIILMFSGGCAGSTAGGVKVIRFAIIFKSLKREFKKLIHPNSVSHIKFDGSNLDEGVVKGVSVYFCLIIVLLFGCLLVISLNGFDFLTSFSATVTCINNVGPGLGDIIGPTGSFAQFNSLSKIVLSITMLIGRLEIYPIILLFLPKTWSNKV